MSHSDSGLKGILKYPFFYNTFQRLVGANKECKILVEKYMNLKNGAKILDIGCGTALILKYLHKYNVEYYGFDFNEDYIDQLNLKYKDYSNYNFIKGRVNDFQDENFGNFDIVLARAVLHHLDDKEATSLVNIAYKSLIGGGGYC